MDKVKKSQEMFENERLKKLLQKSKSYEKEINNYLNGYLLYSSPNLPEPSKRRDIRSASSIITVESADDDWNDINSKNESDDPKNKKKKKIIINYI